MVVHRRGGGISGLATATTLRKAGHEVLVLEKGGGKIKHKDLYTMLYQLAVKEGAKIRFNTCVTEVDSSTASVTTESGETIFADVIVGADGYDSVLRQVVTDSEDEPPNAQDRHVIVTFTIPVHEMESDGDLRELLNLSEVGGKDLTATIIHTYSGSLRPEQEDWSENRTLEQLQKILKRATSVASRFYYVRQPPDDFVCANSRVVLAGDRHTPCWLPGSNHGVSLIMEDAQTLGSLFARIRSRDQISQLLTAYEEIRHPHCYETQTWDYHQRLQMKAPVGPQQDGRDELLRQTMAYGGWDHMDEASFRLVWGMELTLFAHDATEKVEDWWGQYGAFITRRHDRSSMEVSVLLAGTTISE
ncbi:hypothetical protein D9619_013771 [Psilocybe cf. subviscida]|uniref:FAD-binding domain-containing protein n=1 Tax=Psilocybe cf. subviscida TaxID=2480587 RepID=A0A8H5EQG7_9AGAR|nr:hypothetical protein D9619_013771 [Psilocybe cf. subviscida]